MAGPDRLPYGTSLSDQLSLIVSVVLFVTLLVSVTGYLAFHAVVIRIARRLRAPPTQLNENIKQAIDRFRSKLGNTDSSSGLGPNGTAATDPYIMLPAYGNKTAAVRRRLILASRNPASYNTYFGSRRIKLAPVDARAEPLFQPAYHKQGSPSERKIIYGFFHPYANAGGGGERVLWAAVKATLEQSERNICVIYTGLDPPPAPAPVLRAELLQKSGNDRVGQFTDVNRPERILEKARARFGLEIEDPSRVVFIYLTKRKLVDPATWPRLTLLLQAAGSAVLAYEALTTLIPDVWVDTMGYPFTYPLVSWLANIPIAAYVHYPVISTDMITGMVRSTPAGIKKAFKYLYWSAFAWAYTFVGSYVSIIMANSTWTTQHIRSQWWWGRGGSWSTGDTKHVKTVYPPCATQDLEEFPLDQRSLETVYIAQFRPEKRHELVLTEFAKFLASYRKQHGIVPGSKKETPKLVLIGSIRNDNDRSAVYNLRILAHELKLEDHHDIEFVLDAPWTTVTERLSRASFGVDAMWNEHFGMVIVEYMAAGLVPIVHDSAGPKLDIVVPWAASATSGAGKELPTGFHFRSETDPDFVKTAADLTTLATCFTKAYALPAAELQGYRARAREASRRFSDAAFAERWDLRIESLSKLHVLRAKERREDGLAD